jgi:Fe-S-cluster containining protein
VPFACPPDCGWCCTHLTREKPAEDAEFRDVLREEGVYSCRDALGMGLSLSNDEAASLIAEAARRGLRADVHPRTFLLETRRRLAVVLDWHLAHASCPFYADYKCTAYDLRPLVCRAYPVMLAAPRALMLAPECPKMPVPRAALRVEVRARKAIDQAHALLDQRAFEAMARGRFAKGLPAREAAARARRYRVVGLDDYLRDAA